VDQLGDRGGLFPQARVPVEQVDVLAFVQQREVFALSVDVNQEVADLAK